MLFEKENIIDIHIKICFHFKLAIIKCIHYT